MTETNEIFDDQSWQILKYLQANARLSHAELGRRVGLTAPAIAERIRKLEERGIIKGYAVQLDHEKLGYGLLVIVHLSMHGGCYGSRTTQWLQERPEVREAHRVTGADCFILKVAVTTVTHLENFLNELSQHGDVRSSIVLSTVPGLHPYQKPK